MGDTATDRAAQGRAHTDFRDRGADVHLRARAQTLEYEAIIDRIASSGARTILDWGCGWGQMSHLLRQRGLEVSSLEYVAEGAEDRRAEIYPDVEVTYTSEPVALPYADESFDAVLSMGVLEHVGRPEASLDELRRVLAPGGTLWIHKLPNRRSWLEWAARRAGLYYHGLFVDDTLYTVDEARALLVRHGYEVRLARYRNLLPLTLTGAIAWSLGNVIWAANRVLERIPGLRMFATNVEVVAARPAGRAR